VVVVEGVAIASAEAGAPDFLTFFAFCLHGKFFVFVFWWQREILVDFWPLRWGSKW
jgi:hypothetical protein